MSRKAGTKTTPDLAASIEDMSDERLEEIQQAIEAEIRRREVRKAREVRKQIVELAHQHNIDLSTLAGAAKVDAPKYRDPENQFNVWSGRGRKPSWIRKFLAAGGDLEDVKVS